VTVAATDSNRISLCVEVADQALTAPAGEILGRFPFAFTITTGAQRPARN
jgi:hypothetical protein